MKWRWKIAQFFESLWWRAYLYRKPVHAYISWKWNYWRNFLRESGITLLPEEKVLDAGCGPAGIHTVFARPGVTAIDPLMEVYKARLPHFRAQQHPDVHYECVTLEGFHPDEVYDKIFCLNVINHVQNLAASIQRLHELLAPDGTLYLSVDTHNYRLFKQLFRWVPGDILHPHQYDLQEYRDILQRNGLTVIQTSLLKKGWMFDYYLFEVRSDRNKNEN